MMTLNTSTGRAFGTSNLGAHPLRVNVRVPHLSRVKVAMNQQKRKAILEQPETCVPAYSQIGGLLLNTSMYSICISSFLSKVRDWLWLTPTLAKRAARERSKAPCHPRSSCLPARFGVFLSRFSFSFLKPAAFSRGQDMNKV